MLCWTVSQYWTCQALDVTGHSIWNRDSACSTWVDGSWGIEMKEPEMFVLMAATTDSGLATLPSAEVKETARARRQLNPAATYILQAS